MSNALATASETTTSPTTSLTVVTVPLKHSAGLASAPVTETATLTGSRAETNTKVETGTATAWIAGSTGAQNATSKIAISHGPSAGIVAAIVAPLCLLFFLLGVITARVLLRRIRKNNNNSNSNNNNNNDNHNVNNTSNSSEMQLFNQGGSRGGTSGSSSSEGMLESSLQYSDSPTIAPSRLHTSPTKNSFGAEKNNAELNGSDISSNANTIDNDATAPPLSKIDHVLLTSASALTPAFASTSTVDGLSRPISLRQSQTQQQASVLHRSNSRSLAMLESLEPPPPYQQFSLDVTTPDPIIMPSAPNLENLLSIETLSNHNPNIRAVSQERMQHQNAFAGDRNDHARQRQNEHQLQMERRRRWSLNDATEA
ncbi:hypothetical protein HK100_012540, partial [Physocladia obscura]